MPSYETILKKTDRSVIANYDTCFMEGVYSPNGSAPAYVMKHTVFVFANDAAGSPVGCVVLDFSYDEGQRNFMLRLDAIPKDPHALPPAWGVQPFGSDAAMEWEKHMETLLGRKLKGNYRSMWAAIPQNQCSRLDEENPYEKLLCERFVAGDIGERCRRDLERALTVINMAVINRGGVISEAHLKGIGDPIPSTTRSWRWA